MKSLIHILVLGTFFLSLSSFAQTKLFYHPVKTDSQGDLLPWYDDDLAKSYSHVIDLVWNFWDTMKVDLNGLPYYMNHQVWRSDFNDPRGLGGDQLQMAMSSWQWLYAYSGNERVKQNMKFLADYYLSHGLSPANCKWPNIPFPYNTLIYSGTFDGDMVIGQGFLQPDKAGSMGLELVHLYKMAMKDSPYFSNSGRYLQSAIQIARTLAAHLVKGDENNSPLPFKVNAFTGEVGASLMNPPGGPTKASYTTNWGATMDLFLSLEKLDPSKASLYEKSFQVLLTWMKNNNKWGPFFEDVAGWSDTQINAVTFARFMMEHPQYFPQWQSQVPGIFEWVYATLKNDKWSKFGVVAINEQSVYPVPGESHMARQGATELLYCALSGDESRKGSALRQLNWATYTVDNDGKNVFPSDENWLTDGYGDYVKHYLWAMAAYPELAPGDADHILSSTSVIQQADYKGNVNKFLIPEVIPERADAVRLYYRTFDNEGTELIRMAKKPTAVLLGEIPLPIQWQPLAQGGVLKVIRSSGTEVTIFQ